MKYCYLRQKFNDTVIEGVCLEASLACKEALLEGVTSLEAPLLDGSLLLSFVAPLLHWTLCLDQWDRWCSAEQSKRTIIG